MKISGFQKKKFKLPFNHCTNSRELVTENKCLGSKSVHSDGMCLKCVKEWVENCIEEGKKPFCPLCREELVLENSIKYSIKPGPKQANEIVESEQTCTLGIGGVKEIFENTEPIGKLKEQFEVLLQTQLPKGHKPSSTTTTTTTSADATAKFNSTLTERQQKMLARANHLISESEQKILNLVDLRDWSAFPPPARRSPGAAIVKNPHVSKMTYNEKILELHKIRLDLRKRLKKMLEESKEIGLK